MTVTDDRWHHYIFTWKDWEQKFYIDGVEVLCGRVSACRRPTSLFAIGWLGRSKDNRQWHGPFAELLTFNRALTSKEAARLFQDGISKNKRDIDYLKESILMDLDFSTINPDNFNQPVDPDTILKRIDMLHGVYWGLLMVGFGWVVYPGQICRHAWPLGFFQQSYCLFIFWHQPIQLFQLL